MTLTNRDVIGLLIEPMNDVCAFQCMTEREFAVRRLQAQDYLHSHAVRIGKCNVGDTFMLDFLPIIAVATERNIPRFVFASKFLHHIGSPHDHQDPQTTRKQAPS